MSEENLYEISQDIKARLHALMDQHERGWRGVAATVDALLVFNEKQNGNAAPVMAIYQAVAYECGKRVVTIRAWHHYYTVFSPVWDELPCLVTISQLRLILSEATRKHADPIEILRERLNKAAETGKFIPPDAYEAELSGLPIDWGKRQAFLPIDRAVRSLTTAIKKDGLSDQEKRRIVEFVKWLEGIQKNLSK